MMKGSSSRRGETEESVWRKREMMLAGQGEKDWGSEQEGSQRLQDRWASMETGGRRKS